MIDFIDFMIRLVLAHKNTHDADMRLPSAANAPDYSIANSFRRELETVLTNRLEFVKTGCN